MRRLTDLDVYAAFQLNALLFADNDEFTEYRGGFSLATLKHCDGIEEGVECGDCYRSQAYCGAGTCCNSKGHLTCTGWDVAPRLRGVLHDGDCESAA